MEHNYNTYYHHKINVQKTANIDITNMMMYKQLVQVIIHVLLQQMKIMNNYYTEVMMITINVYTNVINIGINTKKKREFV